MSETLPPRRLPSVFLFALVPLPAWFVLRPLVDPVPPVPALYVSFGFSIFALLATIYLVPALGPTFVKANLKGRDLLKVYNTPMYVASPSDVPPLSTLTLTNRPESMGLVCASVYILLLILFIPFAFSPTSLNGSQAQYTVREGMVINAFPHYQVRCLPFPSCTN
jgi:UDP-N-acetylglucosamine--dolichyl-phosphate N-acetylglucosaminephosphotransferase